MLECVVNISEGRDRRVLHDLAAACGDDLLDVHRDPDHHRSVFTMVGEMAPRRLARAAVERLDITSHDGAHPRMGVVDVVPFIALPGTGAEPSTARSARDRFSSWLSTELAVPTFRYGDERTLPDIRRGAWTAVKPDSGPDRPHATAGSTCVGWRPLLVAYNLWMANDDLDEALEVARAVRGPDVRALGLQVGGSVQVSMNLIAPERVGPAAAWDRVADLAPVARAELVGLIPTTTLGSIPRPRWSQLDLDEDRTIEARVAARPSTA